MTDQRPQLDGPPPLVAGPRAEPEWLAPYVQRKTAEFLAVLDAGVEEEWTGPGRDLREAAQQLVREVVGEMAVHLTAPHGGPGADPVDEARETWAAGS